ncbi:PREDICTED: vomeronasal type-1 receptor 2-like [Chinchilla lanigera]|uniref:vomeronasal type-1 receptor 2-like n=1 Tax=Chinchilla lanigera TaxID=34839 RepID=UPI00038EA8FE|nr:PREDICTED: vomeronasal type-1 receptor 2-like [Chinchilla lanigera]
MASRVVYILIIFLVQIFIGTLGNLSLLGQYLFLYLSRYKTRSIDLIIMHLIVANFLVILSRGIPETMAAYGLEDFLSDFGCKFVFYVSRVGRGVAFGSTCLLSVFQAITISPSSSRWAELKVKFPKYISTFTVLCWVLHLVLNISFSVSLTSRLKNKNITNKIDFAYCSDPRTTKGIYTAHAVYIAIFDVLCMGLMLSACGSMLFILFMHKRRVQYMHRTSNFFRSSPETRATQSILILVIIFVFFYFLSCIMQVYVTFFSHSRIFLFTLDAFLSACFSTVCPFVFMICGHYVNGICCVYSKRNTVI